MNTPVVNLSTVHQGGYTNRRRSTDLIVVHHAATHYKQANGPDDVRAIADWHVYGRRWSGIGYHEVLAEEVNGGRIIAYIVSDPYLQRAHLALQNDVAFGLCCATDFGNKPPAQKWIDALADRIAVARVRWPGARIVGHCDVALRGYGTTCPGGAWQAWKPRLLSAVMQRDMVQLAPPNPTILTTPASPILGPASGAAESAIVYLSARSTQYDPGAVVEIVSAYQREGKAAGVDWFLALAQCAHETGGLTSWWCARPRRNPAGLGVTGDTARQTKRPGVDWAGPDEGGYWRRGLSFARWDPDAVHTHLGRLAAYALPAGEGTPEQQAMIDYALSLRPLPGRYRGAAPTLAGLDGRWTSPGVGYGARIAAMANRMRQGDG